MVSNEIGSARGEADVVFDFWESDSGETPQTAETANAMSVPCGMVDGLPVGLMLVGRHFEESTIYRAAHAFEQAGDWKKM